MGPTPPVTIVVPHYGADHTTADALYARSLAVGLRNRGCTVFVVTPCFSNGNSLGIKTIDDIDVYHCPRLIPTLHPLDTVASVLTRSLPGSTLLSKAYMFARGPVLSRITWRSVLNPRALDLVVFISLYSTLTLHGLPCVRHRSILVPMIDNEPRVAARWARKLLAMPQAIVVRSVAERDAIQRGLSPGSSPPVVLFEPHTDASKEGNAQSAEWRHYEQAARALMTGGSVASALTNGIPAPSCNPTGNT